jgi:hypothetical protein
MREQWPTLLRIANNLPPAHQLLKNLSSTNLVLLSYAQNENDFKQLQKELELVFDYIFQFSINLKILTILKIIPDDLLKNVIFPFLYQADFRGKNSCYLAAKLNLKINPDAFIHFLASRNWQQSELINLYFLIPNESKNKIIQLLEDKLKNPDITDGLKETINEFRFILFNCPNSEPLIPDTPAPLKIEPVQEAKFRSVYTSATSEGSNVTKNEKQTNKITSENSFKNSRQNSLKKYNSYKNNIENDSKEEFPLTALIGIFFTTLFILFFIYNSYSDIEPRSISKKHSGKIPDFWIDAVSQEKITPEFLKADKDYRMGELFLTREKYSEAVILFEDALSVYPQHIKAQFRVGFCRLNLGDYDRAEAAFSKTLKIDKKFKQANLFLARTAIAQNQEEKARNYYEQELKVNKNLQVAIEFAQFLKETGNIEEAEAILKEFQELYPEKGYITTSLANSPLIEPKREPNE